MIGAKSGTDESASRMQDDNRAPGIEIVSDMTSEAFANGVLFPPHGAIMCRPDVTVAQVQAFVAVNFYGGLDVVRITSNGVILDGSHLVQRVAHRGCLRVRVFPMRGGGKSLVGIEANLTELLQEHGVPSKLVQVKVRDLCERSGHDKVAALLESKDPWYRIKKEATDKGLVLVPLAERRSAKEDPLQKQDPWSKYRSSENKEMKPRPNKPPTQIDLSFLDCAGSPAVPVSLDQIYQGFSGVFVCSYQEGMEALQEVTKRSYTTKASAVLFLGMLPPEQQFDAKKVSQVVVPVQIGNTQGAARAVLVQAGTVPVQCPEFKEVKVDEKGAELATVLFQIYPEEDSQLPEPMTVKAYLRTLGFASHIYVREVWATGWYRAGKKVEMSKAQYYHGFLKVVDERLPELLRLSGRNGFFCTARDVDRNPDGRYKVVFLGGLTLEEAQAKLREVSHHFGLVRSKKGYGVRVAEMEYANTKQQLLPGAPVSSDSDESGPRKFKVIGLPAKVDRSQLKKILRAFSWSVRVQKQIGFRTWSVAAKAPPPTRSFRFEEETIVITEDAGVRPCFIGAGDRKAWISGGKIAEVQAVVSTTGSTSSSQTVFPVSDEHDKRFTQIEGQIATIRAEQKAAEQRSSVRIDDIAKRTDSLNTKVEQMQGSVDGFAQVMQQQLTAAFDKFSQANDLKLDHLAQAQQEALKKVEAAGEERLKELQELFAVSPKVRKVEKIP